MFIITERKSDALHGTRLHGRAVLQASDLSVWPLLAGANLKPGWHLQQVVLPPGCVICIDIRLFNLKTANLAVGQWPGHTEPLPWHPSRYSF